MPEQGPDGLGFLLPLPRECRRLDGDCNLNRRIKLAIQADDPRVENAARRYAGARSTPGPSSREGITLTARVEPGRTFRAGEYRLVVRPDGIMLNAISPAACFQGLQTLGQLTDSQGMVPCCEIVDWPDFGMRGLLHDVTRGKVPTLRTLKFMADRLAGLKVNQLQLYIEHAFVFGFDPQIADADHGLTPDEIRELDAHCKERFIDLVPAVATLGHMGRILSLPQYRHLAEIEATRPWEQMSWPERARGFTLDVQNPESFELVRRIWSEILDAFSSPVVNICGDEPWDLGKGRSRDRIPVEKLGEAYIGHILRTHEICAERGRKTQAWSDVVRNHPRLFDRLPRDMAVLHWGYDDRSDYAGSGRFVEAGLETMVCPGTSGWKRIINAMDLAERNIATFARAGKENGAAGLLNTDWGDHGHFNSLACSWHGIALGATCAWRADHPVGQAFDLAFEHWLLAGRAADGMKSRRAGSPRGRSEDDIGSLAVATGGLISALRRASSVADRCETWRLLWQPLEQIAADATLPTTADLEIASQASREAATAIENTAKAHWADPLDKAELLAACGFVEVLAEKARMAQGEGRLSNQKRREMREGIERFQNAYAHCWRDRNKASGLGDIMLVLGHVQREFTDSPP